MHKLKKPNLSRRSIMKIRVSITVILFLFLSLFTKNYSVIILFIAALIHESGHIIVSNVTNLKMRSMKFDIFGASLITENNMSSYSDEVMVAIAGPLLNFLTSMPLLFIPSVRRSSYCELFLYSSLFLAIINILPIRDFDGGRVFYILLSKAKDPKFAYNCISVSSFFIIFSFWTLSVYLLMRFNFSLSLFIFSESLFFKLFMREK